VYNEWYDSVHSPEVTTVPGIISARRFRLSESQIEPGAAIGDSPYLAIYEIDSDDLDFIAKELPARAADGRFNMSPALQTEPPPLAVLYEAI
jgi:hypothetical protein